LKLKFGDYKAVIELLPKIAYRKGFGTVLAEGVRGASQKIGKGSERFAVHVKGLEPSGYDPRGLKGMALAYAVSCRGACHLRHMSYRPNILGKHAFKPKIPIDRFSYEDQPALVKELEDFYTIVDSMIYCHFLCLPIAGPILWDELLQSLNGMTGMGATGGKLVEVARRINDAVRSYNRREGVPSDLQFPERWFGAPLKDGASAGQIVDKAKFKRMVDEFYRLRSAS